MPETAGTAASHRPPRCEGRRSRWTRQGRSAALLPALLVLLHAETACTLLGDFSPTCALQGLQRGRPACTDHTAESALRFMYSYTPEVYAKMRDDEVRTLAYKKAIMDLAPNRTVLDIGTGGLALLAIFAAHAEARRVYAIEANFEAYKEALQAVSMANLTNKITILHGHSGEVELPEKVDLLVHEILGEVASIEGAASVIRDAQRRHLAAFPSSLRTSVPASAASYIAPCEFPDGDYWASLDQAVILPPNTTTLKLWRFPKRNLLGEWQEMEYLDFEAEGGLPEVQHRELTFEATRDGELAGFVVKMEASLLGQASREIQTWCYDDARQEEGCRGHWAQQVILWQDASSGSGVPVAAGDVIRLAVTVDSRTMQPSYALDAALVRREGGELRLGLRVLDRPNFG